MQESGVINKTTMVFGQMNEPPGARMRVGLTGLTMAEYFRDQAGKDVLLFIDNIFRFTQAGSEVSALLGRMPSAVGYQPTLQTEMGALQERITSTKNGSITSVQAVYVPADDLTDPAPANTFAHLDATTVLSRAIVELGIYPAVDPLESSSRILDPRIVGEEHYKVARGVQEVLQKYKELQDIIAMLGMDAFDEWALHGPYLDKTLIRNYMWYNLAGEIMDYAPNVRFCEVLLNGVYQGLYVMTETVSSGADARLKLTEPSKDTVQTSYALRLDRGSGNEVKNIETFSQYALRNLQDMDIVYPGTKWLTPERAAWIAQDFSDFEKSLYSYDYDTEPYAWWEQADMSSFVDYFILNEFTCNYDAGWLSTYIYRDVRGKYKMCIWDFNSACDNYSHPVTEPQHFELQYNVWYYMLSKDEDFMNAVIERYRALRQGVLSDAYLNGYMEAVVEWLGPAVDRNFSVWGYTLEKDMLSPAERNPHTHTEAVAQMKRFCTERGAWMDENIDILRQYSHESKNKKFNH